MYKNLKVSLYLLLVFFLLGSFSILYTKDSKKNCEYEYFNGTATLKGNKHVSVVVEFTAKKQPFKQVKEFYIRGGQIERLGLKGYFGHDDILPVKIGRLVKGECEPKRHKIREEYYKVVQTEILWFNDDYTDKDHTKEVALIFQNFSALKRDFPNIVLKIHGHFDQRKQHEYSSDLALSYADTIKTMLIAKGLNATSLQTSAYHDDPMPDIDSKEIFERVSFKIKLNF